MSDPTFAQDVAAFDKTTRKMRRRQLSIVLLGPLLFLIVWGINATGLADQLGWSSFFKNFARSFTGGWAIGAIPVLLLTAFELRKQRGSVVTVKDRLIQQKSAKRTREIYFHEIKRVIVFRDAKTQKPSLSIMRGSFHNMAILDQERMDELIELLRERMPDSAEIIESSQRQYSYRLLLSVLPPFLPMLLILGFNIWWRAVPITFDLLSFALFLPVGLWMFVGGLTSIQRYLHGKSGGTGLRVLEFVAGLFVVVLVATWVVPNSRFFSTTHSCGIVAGRTSGCYRFIEEADDGFDFVGSSNAILITSGLDLVEIEFGRFWRGWSTEPISDYDNFFRTIQSSNDQQRFVTGNFRKVQVWDRMQTDQPIWEPEERTYGHALSFDGSLVALAGTTSVYSDRTEIDPMRVWDVDQNVAIASYDEARFSTFVAGNLLAFVTPANTLVLVNPRTNQTVQTTTLPAEFGELRGLEIDPNAEVLAAIQQQGITLYALPDLQPILETQLDIAADMLEGGSVAFSAENQHLYVLKSTAERTTNSETNVTVVEFSVTDELFLRVYDTTNGQLVRKQLVITDQSIYSKSIDISADGSKLGVGTNQGLFIYDVADLMRSGSE